MIIVNKLEIWPTKGVGKSRDIKAYVCLIRIVLFSVFHYTVIKTCFRILLKSLELN